MNGRVLSTNRNPRHGFSKQPQAFIRLLAGKGVQGDAHCGETVQHIYLKRRNPAAPNRMQVHLLQSELFQQLPLEGATLQSGDLGENITTTGIDLLHLPVGTRLRFGENAVVELTGLRSPCQQIEKFRQGLLKRMIANDVNGPQPRAGVMSIVLNGGDVFPGDTIAVDLPARPHKLMTMI